MKALSSAWVWCQRWCLVMDNQGLLGQQLGDCTTNAIM